MSNRRIAAATLDGWNGPSFPAKLIALHEAYAALKCMSGQRLQEMAGTIAGFRKALRPTTNDDYSWFWALVFRKGAGRVAILFPWAQDWAKRGGTQTDRSIAVCTRGPVAPSDVEEIIAAMIELFSKLIPTPAT